MTQYDLVIRNGQTVTDKEQIKQDVGIKDGKIVTLGDIAEQGTREIDADGLLILPGGIDAHCHIEQKSSSGIMTADDFYSGSVSAAFGGTTTILPFAAQHRGQSLRQVVDEYMACAEPKAVIDYGFHLIISDASDDIIGQELPAMIEDGITSFKIYMTYDDLKLDDYEILNVLAAARREQAMVMIHAENHDVIRWITEKLLDQGCGAPRYHAIAHAQIAEKEATHRAIALAELLDTPMLVVHVSSEAALNEIRRAQERGLKIYGETCPQYLFLTIDDLDKDGMDGAMFCCSPPPRDKQSQEAIWSGLIDGSFTVFSSDHAPYRYDSSGKLSAGAEPTFDKIANGVPGIEIRMPLLFSAGVTQGRMDIHRFVEVTATNAAKTYGLYPKKGTIAVGSDADLGLWDPEKQVEIKADDLHDNMDYSPYEGMIATGWPITVISRGRIVVEENELKVERGSGQYLKRERPEAAKPLEKLVKEMNPETNFNAKFI
ncbi:MAG: dihydropyrimidinase [Kordiimonadaceae bacterium]|jgi:dihydropyrimidinase|nr:dihydropyrimidinase [Kordiimonadaceae bacterium]MBT6036359.1 dihydropyrimidinase [Kordiimonadaceae bacterium]MBT6329165.1 dihydropyrimidinase [Kordiimonadaceae bacterium]MBT7583359.1 dihydropyrimidinase [Kordiimonadaceae bacterium]